MGLSENLTEIKNQTDALLNFANETTGEQDARLGDAVMRLASGYGSGGSELPSYLHFGFFNTGDGSTTLDDYIHVDFNGLNNRPSILIVFDVEIWTELWDKGYATIGGLHLIAKNTGIVDIGIARGTNEGQFTQSSAYPTIVNVSKDGFDFQIYRNTTYPILPNRTFAWIVVEAGE